MTMSEKDDNKKVSAVKAVSAEQAQETVQQTTLVTQKGDKEIRTIDDVVEIAVKEAKERGANALSNFKCDIVYNPNLNTIIRYEISGFCIKRNN